jgi:penicillin-binding protein 1C
MVTEILSGLDRPDLPNNFASSFNLPLVAFKTGTSYGRRDAWSIGYSSEFTVGVWTGNVNHQGNPELVGSKAAAPLLFDILNAIATQHGKEILPVPRDVGLRSVCANSGLPPSPRCTHLIEDYYSITQTVQRVCDVCREYMVSEDGRTSFCTSCLGDNRYKALTFIDYPPELLNYWQKTGEHVTAAPPHNHRCVRVFAGNGPSIVTPSTDMTYYLFSKNQRLALQASSGVDVLEHIWYLNDEYLGRRKVGEKLFVTVREGENTVTCMDDRGRASTVRMRVRYVM